MVTGLASTAVCTLVSGTDGLIKMYPMIEGTFLSELAWLSL